MNRKKLLDVGTTGSGASGRGSRLCRASMNCHWTGRALGRCGGVNVPACHCHRLRTNPYSREDLGPVEIYQTLGDCSWSRRDCACNKLFVCDGDSARSISHRDGCRRKVRCVAIGDRDGGLIRRALVMSCCPLKTSATFVNECFACLGRAEIELVLASKDLCDDLSDWVGNIIWVWCLTCREDGDGGERDLRHNMLASDGRSGSRFGDDWRCQKARQSRWKWQIQQDRFGDNLGRQCACQRVCEGRFRGDNGSLMYRRRHRWCNCHSRLRSDAQAEISLVVNWVTVAIVAEYDD